MRTLYDIDSFNNWVFEFVKNSEQPFVKSAQEMINYFFDLERLMPDKYGWRYYDVEAFRELINKSNQSPTNINFKYWGDVMRTLEAYGIIIYFRTNEVLRTAIRSLNNQEIVPSAILTRSLLELASTMIENANVFLATINQLPEKENSVFRGDEEFEKLLLRIIWGTRLGDDIPEHLKQKNILSILERLSKNVNARELLEKYKFLCELAHPNWLGNARFWSEESTPNPDGSITIVIQKKGYSALRQDIIENIIWGIGWSAACVRNGYYILQGTILTLSKKFPGIIQLNSEK
jgi:uncharacterized protein YqgQ